MTILWAGTERDAFIVPAGAAAPPTSTAGGTFDANFSRAGLNQNTSNSVRFRACTLFGDILEAWVHFRTYFQDTNWASGATPWQVNNAAGTGLIRFQTTSLSQWQFQYWNGSAWTQIGSTRTRPAGTHTFDVHILVADSGGEFLVNMDGSPYANWSLTGDTLRYTGAAIDQVVWGNYATTGVTDFVVTECAVADVSTLGIRVATLPPTGNGTYTAWTGTYADVDESGIDDANFISTTTADQLESFTLQDLSVTAAGYDPVAVCISSRGRIGATGPTNYQHLLITDSTDFLSANVDPTTTFNSVEQTVYNQNPDTMADWTVSEINALEAGVKSIA